MKNSEIAKYITIIGLVFLLLGIVLGTNYYPSFFNLFGANSPIIYDVIGSLMTVIGIIFWKNGRRKNG